MSPYYIHAQKNVNFLDVFYEALSKDSTEKLVYNLTAREFVLDNYEQLYISPKTIIAKYPDAKRYLVKDSLFIIKCDIQLGGKIMDLSTIDPKIEFKNMIFQKLEMNLNLYYKTLANEVFFGSALSFENVSAKSFITFSNNFQLYFNDSDFQRIHLGAGVECPGVFITNSKIDYITINHTQTHSIVLKNNKINRLKIAGSEIKKELRIEENIFDPLKDGEPVSFLIDAEIEYLYLTDNHFLKSEQHQEVRIIPSGASVNISNNRFEEHLHLGNKTRSFFEVKGNNFSTVCLMASLPQTPQNYVSIKWEDLSNKMVWKPNLEDSIYFGKTDKELADAFNFNNLISSYGKLIDVYKNNRNIVDANKVYLEMKLFEQQRFKHIYKTEGGSINYFRLKLHQLLAVFTRHGTDPAQAITASAWLIVLFSFIYFFFPSDWDVKSKPQMISDFRTFVQKNEHGYFKPFLRLSQGVIISMFNALILSVNAFVTLGFGTIPTKGLAKHICILEGLLGWFLLSLFIASLLNQVLF